MQVHHAAAEDQEEWDQFVGLQLGSSNYHRYKWRQVIEQSFGHRTFYLAARDDNGTFQGVLPLAYMKSPLFGRFMVSLPFFNYGGLLSASPLATNLLLRESESIRGRVGAPFAELRHVAAGLDGLVSRQHKVSMILDLKGNCDEQWRALDPKVRNQIRKAQKSGLSVRVGHMDLLDGFYGVFSRNMRDLGTPVYGRSFFENILQTFPNSTRIISILLNETTIASGLLTWFRETLEVPWASSISDHREKCPNNLLYWEAIKFAISVGAFKFDFGRSTPGEGTFRFKKQWGALPVPLNWQYQLQEGTSMPDFNPSNPKYRLAIRLWQQLPLTVANLLGPGIVRNIP